MVDLPHEQERAALIDFKPTRRSLLSSLALTATAPMLVAAAPKLSKARKLDFAVPADNIYGLLKLMGDLSGERTYVLQYGRIYGFSEGKMARHILNYTGLTTREIRQDSTRSYVTRYGGWMLMRDPATDQVIDRWTSPLTGESLPIEHFVTSIGRQRFTENGLVRPPGFKGDFQWFDKPFILPWRVIGDDVWAPYEQFSVYKDRAGNSRYEKAIHTYQGKLSALTGTGTNAPSSIASQSQSPYFPWMKMEAAGGHMILHSAGRKLASAAEIPPGFARDIERRYPGELMKKFNWETA
jgi:hypothetical protein